VLAAIDGGRDGIYAALYDEFAQILYAPVVAQLDEIVELASGATALAGSAAPRIAAAMASENFEFGPRAATGDIATYARVGLDKGFAGGRPQPLYLRAPDAKPQAHFALPRRDG
jgi:tRNA A37 threonylcarbamoyladenosine modification protein TsaB